MSSPPLEPHRLLFFRRLGPEEKGVQKFSHYDSFRFAARLHQGQGQKQARLPESEIDKLADMFAATFAHFISMDPNGYMARRLLRDGMNCCIDILRDLGYEVAPPSGGQIFPGAPRAAAVLVPGCQTLMLLKSRAYAGAELYHLLMSNGNPVTCLLSGLRPPGATRFAIPDESATLKHHFIEYFANRIGKHAQDLGHEKGVIAKTVGSDGVSQVTDANVRAFSEVLRSERQRDPGVVAVASSTFHLIKIAPLLEASVAEMWPASSTVHPANTIGDTEDRSQVKPRPSLLLIGAETAGMLESREESPVVWHPSYVKSLFFAIFRYLLAHDLLPS